MKRENVIEIRDLKKNFGAIQAVDGISLDIPKGTIYGILGPNGAGKSTLIRMLCGVITPSSGTGHVLGFELGRETEKIKQRIGHMSQKFSLYEDLTVYENLKFYTEIYSVPKKDVQARIQQVVDMAGLQGRENQITGSLSGGWKQRLALGCALIHRPELLILDEPTSSVDPVSRRVFWQIIFKLAARGITILVTTHYMDEAESCDEVVFVFRGKVIGKGHPKTVVETMECKSLEDVFIKFVEIDTGQKVETSFEAMKFLEDREGDEDHES